MNARQFCGYLWIVFFAGWILWAFWSKPVKSRESLSTWMPDAVLTLAGLYIVFGEHIPGAWLRLVLFPPLPWIEIAGLVLTISGMLTAVWARTYLGRNWSGTVTVKVGHELIRTGPYRWVRHPIYSGLMLASVGTALAIDQARGLVAVILLYIGFRMKSRVEERIMLRVFAGAYEEYSRTTGAIIPRLHS